MMEGAHHDQDVAVFDQLQATALDLIRDNSCWFIVAVDRELGASTLIACPEEIVSETLDAEELFRSMLRHVISAAAEELARSLIEKGEA